MCTGNICRSPYIERRLRQELAGTGVEVSSAGTAALVGHEMDPGTRSRLVARGADIEGFRARQLTVAMLEDADVVVTAARSHRAEVTRLYPACLRRTTTLRDLADLLDGVPAHDLTGAAPEQSATECVLAAALDRRGLVAARQEGVDVHDPVGGGPADFYLMAAQVEAALPPVVAALRAARGG
ncbi:low molecular weight phosphatase family protein [Phycicoccus endophyticus]|uniref:arsenate reductase/protein-tyrosine-phosphatase family protein n=1 Tax=Phycicoccus endophyticus TaxID=1690220 RepID=UPI00140923E8|nr:low molecular weight phosphatase family protein [Phycicoccus endophyticus]NHI20389.1 low molecular weight phosphatase family protein [Phycicoccus endophyticus]